MSKIFSNIEKYKEKIALVDNSEKSYSYNEVVDHVKEISKNVKKKTLILFVSSNTLESIVGYISFVRNDNLIILLDKSVNKKFVNDIIYKYNPSYIYKPKKNLVIKNSNDKIYNGKEYEIIRTSYGLKNNYHKKNFILLTTSGSTGNPKLVRLSEENIIDNTKKIKDYLKINIKNTTITTMPMAYSYGLSIINTFIYSGGKIILNDKSIFEKIFWNKINSFNVNSISGVPEFFKFLKKLKFEKFNLKNIKYLTHAGGYLEKDIIKYFVKIAKKNKYKFFSMYGQTEASPRMSYLECTKEIKKIGSIGKPLKGSKFFIINEKKKVINKNYLNGEIVYKGKNVCLGYAKNLNDLNKGNLNKGELFTGDIGYKDKDGYYYLTGRKNRISKIFGLRFNIDDIENKLKKNNFLTKIIPSNNSLKIFIINNYDVNKIKSLIFDLYKINKNFILINKVKKFTNNTLFYK